MLSFPQKGALIERLKDLNKAELLDSPVIYNLSYLIFANKCSDPWRRFLSLCVWVWSNGLGVESISVCHTASNSLNSTQTMHRLGVTRCPAMGVVGTNAVVCIFIRICHWNTGL